VHRSGVGGASGVSGVRWCSGDLGLGGLTVEVVKFPGIWKFGYVVEFAMFRWGFWICVEFMGKRVV